MSEIIMNSPTYGKVNMLQIVEIIKNFLNKDKFSRYEITIGTDSQNFNRTKMTIKAITDIPRSL